MPFICTTRFDSNFHGPAVHNNQHLYDRQCVDVNWTLGSSHSASSAY